MSSISNTDKFDVLRQEVDKLFKQLKDVSPLQKSMMKSGIYALITKLRLTPDEKIDAGFNGLKSLADMFLAEYPTKQQFAQSIQEFMEKWE